MARRFSHPNDIANEIPQLDQNAEIHLFIGRDAPELLKVREFRNEGTKLYSRGIKAGQCSQQFSLEAMMVNLNNCLELSHAELDLVVLANIQVHGVTCCFSPFLFARKCS